MKDFYDDIVPLSKTEKKAIAEAPDLDSQMLKEFSLAARVGAPMELAELIITLPVLNIRGISSARVGAEATSVVPTTASASLNLAVMKGMDYRKTVATTFVHKVSTGVRSAV